MPYHPSKYTQNGLSYPLHRLAPKYPHYHKYISKHPSTAKLRTYMGSHSPETPVVSPTTIPDPI
eukprot:CAMPEP_0184744368 /NCGR_PEP_ID=MMETSP0315-20130426/7160_1 /TAXON_ID=101924 /ORGANISM="Rhodosorus marinus, Strain UTEX LB 2760" /LENGTH=63 /DNA_ID=CAMNT_0027216067 /DNA_START=1232 /DNA_END=1423 /DNA_ORIENTATION=-